MTKPKWLLGQLRVPCVPKWYASSHVEIKRIEVETQSGAKRVIFKCPSCGKTHRSLVSTKFGG